MLCVIHLRENCLGNEEWKYSLSAVLSQGQEALWWAQTCLSCLLLLPLGGDAAGLEKPEGKQGKGLLPRTAASHNSPSGFLFSVSWMCVYTAPVSCSLLPHPHPPRYKWCQKLVWDIKINCLKSSLWYLIFFFNQSWIHKLLIENPGSYEHINFSFCLKVRVLFLKTVREYSQHDLIYPNLIQGRGFNAFTFKSKMNALSLSLCHVLLHFYCF